MVYPGHFHRLVMYGGLYSDVFNTSLSIVPMTSDQAPAVSDALLNAVATACSDFWASGGGSNISITGSAILKGVKLNRILPDGHYAETVTKDKLYGTPFPGGGSTGHPPQLSVVATLRTAAERGLASKGRMYLPSITGFQQLQADGRALVGTANLVVSNVILLIRAINAAYASNGGPGGTTMRVGVASGTRGGQFREVTRVSCGRVPDTMRSRRNKQAEAPLEAPV